MLKISKSALRPKFELSDGSIEALKWLALILMTIDHINQFLLGLHVPLMYKLGRIAMPLFGFVLAYNLARPDALQKGMHARIMKKLLIYGVLAAPFFIALRDWLPLNIMFTLLLATYLIYLIEQGGQNNFLLCGIVLITAGVFVDYAWLAPIYCISAWWFCKSPDLSRALLWAGMTGLLWFGNMNYWACAALPVIFLATYINIKIPRLRHIFYAYYPAHLAILVLMQRYMTAN